MSNVKFIIKRHDGKYIGKTGRPCILLSRTMEFDTPITAQRLIDKSIDDSFAYSHIMYVSPEEHESKPFSEWRVYKKTTEITIESVE